MWGLLLGKNLDMGVNCVRTVYSLNQLLQNHPLQFESANVLIVSQQA